MTFAEKLRAMRKQTGMSQEQLAEKLGVSRQAVTKWETDTGIPDTENIMAVSALFDISIDELLGREREGKRQTDFLFESVTEYDIDMAKRYDIKLGEGKRLVVSGYDGEKIRVRLVSNTLPNLQSDFKVKIDDIKNRIDVEVRRGSGVTAATAKEAISIFVEIPSPYIDKIELAANVEALEVHHLNCDSIELEVKTPGITLDEIIGTVEINCNLDMNIACRSLNGEIAINQVSAASRISVPEDIAFATVKKGFGTSIVYERNGQQTERFDTPGADNVIELNGINAELIICTGEGK